MKPTLVEGIASLKVGDAWVDATTDLLARETGKFVAWTDAPTGIVTHVGLRVRRGTKSVREALFRDADDRMWKQAVLAIRGGSETMVVKVSAQNNGEVLIMNRDRSLIMQTTPSGPLTARMRGQSVRFFVAEVTNGIVELGEALPPQDW